jgi:hypothetical protein
LGRTTAHSEQASVESLAIALSPLASLLLRGKLSTSVLIRAAKIAYLRASISELNTTGVRPNVSRLSVITGMTRKEVASLLRDGDASPVHHPQKRSLEHRAVRVLRGWTTDPLYMTSQGRPADLAFQGDGRDFSSLVRAYGGDVTPVSVLRELERLKVISRSRNGSLRVSHGKWRNSLGSYSRLREFSRLLEGFSQTALRSVSEKGSRSYMGLRETYVESKTQAESFKRVFARRAALLLDGVEHWSSRHRDKVTRRKERRTSGLAHRLGVGVYVVHAEPREKVPRKNQGSRRG